jgi:hypothetical protein
MKMETTYNDFTYKGTNKKLHLLMAMMGELDKVSAQIDKVSEGIQDLKKEQ